MYTGKYISQYLTTVPGSLQRTVLTLHIKSLYFSTPVALDAVASSAAQFSGRVETQRAYSEDLLRAQLRGHACQNLWTG